MLLAPLHYSFIIRLKKERDDLGNCGVTGLQIPYGKLRDSFISVALTSKIHISFSLPNFEMELKTEHKGVPCTLSRVLNNYDLDTVEECRIPQAEVA
jgi:hypothetical protein